MIPVFGFAQSLGTDTVSELRKPSIALLVATIFALLLTYIVPVAAVTTNNWTAVALGAAAYILMGAIYWPIVRFYRGSAWWVLTLPAVALFYAGATVMSAVLYWTGKGGAWKGRMQDVHS